MPAQNTEAYRSGHNEAVLKTVCRQRHGGSNPSASAKTLWVDEIYPKGFFRFVNQRDSTESGTRRVKKQPGAAVFSS